MKEQLILDFRLRDEATFENFSSGNNQQLISILMNITLGHGEPLIFLYGAHGYGRTHLLQACCHHAGRSNMTVAYLPLSRYMEFSPDILDGLESLNLVCIDDVQCIVGKENWEKTLFHFYNRAQDSKTSLVISGDTLPTQMSFTLPDLKSRLASGITFQIQPLTDEGKIHVLQSRLKKRGLELTTDVGSYLITHLPRDMNELISAVDQLDKASLKVHRKLTIPFIKEVLLD